MTLNAVAYLLNRVNPPDPKWADISTGPVSLATTNKLSLINVDNYKMFGALFWD